MRVYYMTSHRIATEYILPEKRLKLSLFDQLNDPFELQPHSLAEQQLRRINRALREEYFGKRGVLCFTSAWHSPVMWAHYAEKHSGICLGFDVPERRGLERLIEPIVYAPERLAFLLDSTKDLYGIDATFVLAMLLTKSREWAYEQEYRVIADLKVKDPATGHYYVDFGSELQLREVILGARNTTPVGQVAKLVRGPEFPVSVFKARAALQEFAMVPNRRISPIKIRARRPAGPA